MQTHVEQQKRIIAEYETGEDPAHLKERMRRVLYLCIGFAVALLVIGLIIFR